MEALGFITLLLFVLFLVVGGAIAVMSLPDINRYRRLKRM